MYYMEYHKEINLNKKGYKMKMKNKIKNANKNMNINVSTIFSLYAEDEALTIGIHSRWLPAKVAPSYLKRKCRIENGSTSFIEKGITNFIDLDRVLVEVLYTLYNGEESAWVDIKDICVNRTVNGEDKHIRYTDPLLNIGDCVNLESTLYNDILIIKVEFDVPTFQWKYTYLSTYVNGYSWTASATENQIFERDLVSKEYRVYKNTQFSTAVLDE